MVRLFFFPLIMSTCTPRFPVSLSEFHLNFPIWYKPPRAREKVCPVHFCELSLSHGDCHVYNSTQYLLNSTFNSLCHQLMLEISTLKLGSSPVCYLCCTSSSKSALLTYCISSLASTGLKGNDASQHMFSAMSSKTSACSYNYLSGSANNFMS